MSFFEATRILDWYCRQRSSGTMGKGPSEDMIVVRMRCTGTQGSTLIWLRGRDDKQGGWKRMSSNLCSHLMCCPHEGLLAATGY